MRNVRSLIEYLLYRLLGILVWFFPEKELNFIAQALGWLLSKILVRRREIARKKLGLIFKGLPPEKYLNYLPEIFGNFIRMLFSYFRVSNLSSAYIQKHISFSGLENLDTARREYGSFILLTAHLGNWELGGIILSKLGYPLVALAWESVNPFIEKVIFKNRLRAGEEIILLKHGELKNKLREAIKRQKVIALLGDIGEGRKEKVNFFGKKTPFPTGAMVLSLRYNIPIVPAFCLWGKNYRYEVNIAEPIKEERSGNLNQDIRHSLEKFVKVLEDKIRKYPTNWLWLRND